MYEVRREIAIDAGHRVPWHDGQCSNLHGHRYKIQAVARAPETVSYGAEESDAGMVVDFADLKDAMMVVHEQFDHKLILWEGDFLVKADVTVGLSADDALDQPQTEVERYGSTIASIMSSMGMGVVVVPVLPTAEELARYWFGIINAELQQRVEPGTDFWLSRVRVYETPNNVATYEPEV